jgi:fructose-bisphosphate aldolase, class II
MIGFRDYFAKKKDYLATQVGNPEGEDKPNKKHYDPRGRFLYLLKLSKF